MSTESLYYQPSGRYPMAGLLAFGLLGGALIVPLALGYAYATWYVPYVLLDLCFLAIYAGLVGYVLKVLARAGRLRSPAVVGWLALLLSLWAWYAQFCAFVTLAVGAEAVQKLDRISYLSTSFDSDIFWRAITHPMLLPGFMREVAAAEDTRTVLGISLSGGLLYSIWVVEFLAIVLIGWSLPFYQAQKPFSEVAGQWAERVVLPEPAAHFTDAAATRAALEAADWQHLQPLAPGLSSLYDPHGRLSLYRAPTDPDCCYLSLENVIIKPNKQGTPRETATDVLQYLHVPTEVAHELEARFGARQPGGEAVPG